MPDPAGEPAAEPVAEPDVTEDEVGDFFDKAIGACMLRDGIPTDAVATMRERHIVAVFESPAALDGIRELRRTVPPMDVLLARYARPGLPLHGRNALPHSFVYGCRDSDDCNDNCNNIACPAGRSHERCTVDCLTSAGRELLYVPAWRRILLDGRDDF